VNLKSKLQPLAPPMLSIMRIVAGLIFMEHGMQKLLGFPPGGHAGPALMTVIWWSGVIELIAGGLIVLGLFTRGAAFIASGMCAVAYWTVHAPQGPYPVNNGGDAAILFCFLFLYLVFAGPGPWSADALRKR
jgi:putative oxidoreductase